MQILKTYFIESKFHVLLFFLIPELSEENKKSGMTQVTLMKWLLTSSSHLGRALAELFGLLVNQCIGSDHSSRLRRHAQNANQSAVPTVKSRAIATLLTKLLMKGLSWKCPDTIKVPRLRYLNFPRYFVRQFYSFKRSLTLYNRLT